MLTAGLVTATVIEAGADTMDLGAKEEYWTLTGVCGRLIGSGLMLAEGVGSCWWMMVVGWAPCAGAGVMVVPSL